MAEDSTRDAEGLRPSGERTVFLPDFCAIPVVFSIVIIGQLLAFVLVVAGGGFSPPAGTDPGRSWWSDLALTSLFVQWVGLGSTAILCVLRRRLVHASDALAGAVGFAVVLASTALATEIGLRLVGSPWVEPGADTGWAFTALRRLASADPSGHRDLLLRNLAISAIVAAVAFRYFYVQHQWRRQLEREAHARIQALQSRIRPHFLFNSMNTIASFTRTDPALAEQMVEDLAELFRVSLSDARIPSTLEREIELGRQYVRIERLRLGERLRVDWDVDELLAEAAQALLPALTVQPLLENAVYHGIEPAAEGGVIRVSGGVRDGVVELRLVNTVSGRAPVRAGHRMALDNVSERVGAFFGAAGSLAATGSEEGFTVTLRFPVLTRC